MKPRMRVSTLLTSLVFGESPRWHAGRLWFSDWAAQGVIAVDAQVGKGHVFLYGPEILMRAQPRGTFKFLFNAIYWGR